MYFTNPQTLEDLKQQYRALALKHHPDKGGDTAIMQAVSAEYEQLFERLKDTHRNKDGQIYTASAPSDETAAEFVAIINILMKLDGLIIEICGRFLWLTGNTKTHRNTIKGLSFRWSHNKRAWYMPPKGYRKISRTDWTLADIRHRFGSDAVFSQGADKITDDLVAA